jgi:hypothetical protein
LALRACALLVATFVSAAGAQDAAESDLEVTIRLLPENAVGPEEITRRIELPPARPRRADPAGDRDEQQRADDGRGPADVPGRGDDVSAEARERGREFGQEAAERARENREDAGRPDDAGPPEPQPPSNPGGRPEVPPGRE